MTADVEDLPDLVEAVTRTAPAGTDGRIILQLTRECYEFGLEPREVWRREVSR